MTRKLLLWLPFAIGLVLVGVFYAGLRNPGEREIASQMVGKQLPAFATLPVLPAYAAPASTDFADGKPRLINVFASWCVPCVAEMPILLRLKQQGIEIEGIAIHDTPEQLTAFLARNGNPYSRVGMDDSGRAGLAFGSSGVPETFVIDGKGKILYQHMRALTEDDVPQLLELMGDAR